MNLKSLFIASVVLFGCIFASTGCTKSTGGISDERARPRKLRLEPADEYSGTPIDVLDFKVEGLKDSKVWRRYEHVAGRNEWGDLQTFDLYVHESEKGNWSIARRGLFFGYSNQHSFHCVYYLISEFEAAESPEVRRKFSLKYTNLKVAFDTSRYATHPDDVESCKGYPLEKYIEEIGSPYVENIIDWNTAVHWAEDQSTITFAATDPKHDSLKFELKRGF